MHFTAPSSTPKSLHETYKPDRSGIRVSRPRIPVYGNSIPVSSKRSAHLANIDSRLFNYQLISTSNHHTINNFPHYLFAQISFQDIFPNFQNSFENNFKTVSVYGIHFQIFISSETPSTKHLDFKLILKHFTINILNNIEI